MAGDAQNAGVATIPDPTSPSTPAATALPALCWQQDGREHVAGWRCERGSPPPQRVLIADDTMPADTAYRLANEGTALLWAGDFQNARHLLQALARRADRLPQRKRRGARPPTPDASPAQSFHHHRMAQGQRARLLAQLLIPLQPDYGIALRRAPDLRQACSEAWGAPPDGADASVVSLRELLGIVGAHEWRKKGVAIGALGTAPNNRIHAHYGVFSPVRGEYVDLVAAAPLPTAAATESVAFDIGTGTGVLAAVLARRGMHEIVATENDPRALACARDNLARLGLLDRVTTLQVDLYPPGRAALVVCNPPWLPARPGSAIERALYDDGGRMLAGFVAGLRDHLLPGGEGWLLLSDLAEHLGLRTREQLLALFAAHGLGVAARIDTRPRHPKALDANDPLHAARSAEITSLWRLVPA